MLATKHFGFGNQPPFLLTATSSSSSSSFGYLMKQNTHIHTNISLSITWIHPHTWHVHTHTYTHTHTTQYCHSLFKAFIVLILVRVYLNYIGFCENANLYQFFTHSIHNISYCRLITIHVWDPVKLARSSYTYRVIMWPLQNLKRTWPELLKNVQVDCVVG